MALELARRRAGKPNRLTLEAVEYAKSSEELPLAFLLRVMRNDKEELARQLEAAKAAAPCCHHRLSALQIDAKMDITHEEALDLLA